MAKTYSNLGNLYKTRGEPKDAEEMYKKSLAIFTLIGNKIMIRKVRSSIKQLTKLRKNEEH